MAQRSTAIEVVDLTGDDNEFDSAEQMRSPSTRVNTAASQLTSQFRAQEPFTHRYRGDDVDIVDLSKLTPSPKISAFKYSGEPSSQHSTDGIAPLSLQQNPLFGLDSPTRPAIDSGLGESLSSSEDSKHKHKSLRKDWANTSTEDNTVDNPSMLTPRPVRNDMGTLARAMKVSPHELAKHSSSESTGRANRRTILANTIPQSDHAVIFGPRKTSAASKNGDQSIPISPTPPSVDQRKSPTFRTPTVEKRVKIQANASKQSSITPVFPRQRKPGANRRNSLPVDRTPTRKRKFSKIPKDQNHRSQSALGIRSYFQCRPEDRVLGDLHSIAEIEQNSTRTPQLHAHPLANTTQQLDKGRHGHAGAGNRSPTTRQDQYLTANEHEKIATILRAVIFPAINASKKRYEDTILDEDLSPICKTVSVDIVKESILLLRQCDFEPGFAEKENLTQRVNDMIDRKMSSTDLLHSEAAYTHTSQVATTARPLQTNTGILHNRESAADRMSSRFHLAESTLPSAPVRTGVIRDTHSVDDDEAILDLASMGAERPNLIHPGTGIIKRPSRSRLVTGDSFRRYCSPDNLVRGKSFSRKILGQAITPSTTLPPKSKASQIQPIELSSSGPATSKEPEVQSSKGHPITEKSLSRAQRKLRTAQDPDLEVIVGALITNEPGLKKPSTRHPRGTITANDQEDLLTRTNVLKHVEYPAAQRNVQFSRLETRVADPACRPERCIPSLLRHRELGSSSAGRNVDTHQEIRLKMAAQVKPWRSWKGASGDVGAVAWAPDSIRFAAGAAAPTNVEDLQYNRYCNLLFGDISTNKLRELPDHRLQRPRPETVPSGPNSTRAVYEMCDPMVYQTVTSVAFSAMDKLMYTASYDQTVKIWDTSKYECVKTIGHPAQVTSVEVSGYHPGLFATASNSIQNAVRVYSSQHPNTPPLQFSSSRAEAKPRSQLYPECLRWGSVPFTSHLLLAGFQSWGEQDKNLNEGQLCLWDVNTYQGIRVLPSSQSVFAATWHPILPFFATGGAPGATVTDRYTTKSVVRSWDLRYTKHYAMEYECPASDMQDITFHPHDSNIVTAGCTDGTSLIWDFRWPDQPIHRLRHGRALQELDHTRSRAEADTGVMMSLWGLGGSLYYTGSSDGMIKEWNIRRHPEDVLVRNVAQLGAGIQSGAFSPDYTNLLVGDAAGGVHILSSAPCGLPAENDEESAIELIRHSDGSGKRIPQDDDNPGVESILAAKELLDSGQVIVHPEYGVGKGPMYAGPYARHAREETADGKPGKLHRAFYKTQAFKRSGEPRPHFADKIRALTAERKELIRKAFERNPESSSSQPTPASAVAINPNDGPATAIPLPESAAARAQVAPLYISPYPPQPPKPDISFIRAGEHSVPFHRPRSRGGKAKIIEPASDDHDRDDDEPHKHPNQACRFSTPTQRATPQQLDTMLEPNLMNTNASAANAPIPTSEMLEENHWWPRMGEDEIKRVCAGR